MTVLPIDADVAMPQAPVRSPLGQAFGAAVDAAGSAFERADRSERAFASGRSGLLPMAIDRAQADVVLSVASAAASRAAQAVSTIFNMQV